jgi:segregation and condensation protein B
MEREELKSVIESLLFVADAPLSLQRLSAVLEGVERKEIASAARDLQAEYEASGRGFRLAEVAGGYQMRSCRENAEWVRKLQRGKPARMTRATLETLSIVAYRQPITRAEVEDVRGVDSGGVLSSLLERRLIRIVGRKDMVGRPFLYGTTAEFLEMFNLKDLADLPTLKEVEAAPVSDSPPADPSPESGE